MPAVGEILEGKDICICAGSGGVGKTTTSAAIATGMAARGLKVCVLTIDPAKRLADSLGLKELGNEARQVDPALFEQQGVEIKGELWAMMLDAKATFDELVARQAPDEEARDRVLNNRIYQQISSALAGSQEYMAMEKLFELHSEGRFDLLVLDTPPTRNALDFLDAPKRLTQFIEGRSLRVFMKPTGLAAKVAGRGASVALSVFKRIVGFDLLADLAEFFNAFSGMVDGFQARAKRVNSLLGDPHTCFLVVCGPQGEPVDEAVYFHRKLVEAKLPFGGVIVNKVHYPAEQLRGGGGDLEASLAEKLGDEDLAKRVADNFADYQALAERDARNIERLAKELRAQGVIRVPYLDEDVHDLAGLAEINRYLFASSEERTRSRPAAPSWRCGDRSGCTSTRGPPSRRPRAPGIGGARGGCRSARGAGRRPRSPGSRECCVGRLDLLEPGGGGDANLSSSGIGSRMRVSWLMSYSSSGGSKWWAAISSTRGISSRNRDFLRSGDLVGDDDLLRLGNFFRHGDLGISTIEATGDQGLIGSGVEVGAELAESGFAQDAAHAFLDPAGDRQARSRRRSVHQRPLQLERALDPLAGLDPVKALVGDQRRGTHRQRGADGSVAVEHRAQRQQVITEALQRRVAAAAQLEAIDRPGESAVRIGARLQRGGELGKLHRLLLAQLVGAGAGRAGRRWRCGPSAPPRWERRRRDRGRHCRP